MDLFSSFGFRSLRVESLSQITPYKDVELLLLQLKRSLSKEIEIFGSMAREGCGHDLDIIIIGTEEEWQQFREKTLSYLEHMPAGPIARGLSAWDVLGESFVTFDMFFAPLPVDVFIFPQDWRKRLEELQEVFPHEDPDFMRNIEADALTLLQCRWKIQDSR